MCYREGLLVTKATKPEEKSNYEMYYEYSEAIKYIPSHRILAINRGEKEKMDQEFMKEKKYQWISWWKIRYYTVYQRKSAPF